MEAGEMGACRNGGVPKWRLENRRREEKGALGDTSMEPKRTLNYDVTSPYGHHMAILGPFRVHTSLSACFSIHILVFFQFSVGPLFTRRQFSPPPNRPPSIRRRHLGRAPISARRLFGAP